ncbi:MAG: preprotein translocase subunit SecE [Candidatus Acidiferrales bacterium]
MSTTQATKLNTTPTPPDRPREPGGPRTQWIENIRERFKRARQFLHEVRAEMKLVVWPTSTDVRSTTLVVIMTTIIFAVFLWAVDSGATRVVARVLKAYRH